MDNKNTSLIIANMFIVGGFIVDNVIEWSLLLILGCVWMMNYLFQSYAEIRNHKNKVKILEDLYKERLKKVKNGSQ